MYHIPNNKRSKETAFKIYQSVRHNLFTKRLVDITVSDIYKESGIARTTFYRLFDYVSDVLEYQLEIYIKEYIELKKDKNDQILFFFTYFDSHSDLIYITASENDYIFNKVIRKVYDADNKYETQVKIAIMSSILCTWSKNKKKESILEITNITKNILSKNMLEVLTNF